MLNEIIPRKCLRSYLVHSKHSLQFSAPVVLFQGMILTQFWFISSIKNEKVIGVWSIIWHILFTFCSGGLQYVWTPPLSGGNMCLDTLDMRSLVQTDQPRHGPHCLDAYWPCCVQDIVQGIRQKKFKIFLLVLY